MASDDTVAPGVTVMRNLEAGLRAVEASQDRFAVEQTDGEIRYDVRRLGSRRLAILVRDATLEIVAGVVSVRIEGARFFVTVSSGSVTVEDAGRTDILVGGDMLRLPRLDAEAHRARSRPPQPPPPPRARLTRSRSALAYPIELAVVDSSQLTVPRA